MSKPTIGSSASTGTAPPKLHAFVVEYHRLLEVRAKLAKMAIDAGVEERRVQIAEEQG